MTDSGMFSRHSERQHEDLMQILEAIKGGGGSMGDTGEVIAAGALLHASTSHTPGNGPGGFSGGNSLGTTPRISGPPQLALPGGSLGVGFSNPKITGPLTIDSGWQGALTRNEISNVAKLQSTSLGVGLGTSYAKGMTARITPGWNAAGAGGGGLPPIGGTRASSPMDWSRFSQANPPPEKGMGALAIASRILGPIAIGENIVNRYSGQGQIATNIGALNDLTTQSQQYQFLKGSDAVTNGSEWKQVTKGVAAGAGAFGGMAAGAAAGSAIFPGPGTLIGAIIGFLGGGAAGIAVDDAIQNGSDAPTAVQKGVR